MQSKIFRSIFALALLAITGVVSAGTVSIGSASGDAGTTVQVTWSYSNTNNSTAIEWCMEWEAGLSLSDSSSCLSNLPATGYNSFSSCDLNAPACPNGLLIAVVPDNLGSPPELPSTDPVGSFTFEIGGSVATGSTPAVSGACVDETPGGCGGMTITDGAVTVTESVSVLNVTPVTLSFGEQEQSTTSAASSVTIANTGNDGVDLQVTALTFSNSVFAASGGSCGSLPFTLSDGETCTVGVTFTPATDIAYQNETLTVTSDADSVTNNIVTLSGTGTPGPAGALTITPATFDFGEVLTNDTSTQVFTVTNTGAVGSSVDVNAPTVAAPFAVTTNGCATADLAKDESCTITVTFTPIADGAVTNIPLSVSGVDGNSDTKTGTSLLSGTGVTEPRPTANPASGTSESEVVGPEGSNDFTVTFGNTGNANYDVLCALSDVVGEEVWSVIGNEDTTIIPGSTHTVTTTCTLPDTETYTATLSCSIGQETYTYNYECVGLPPLPVPVDNKWALALLALMMLMAASFGFRFITRQ